MEVLVVVVIVAAAFFVLQTSGALNITYTPTQIAGYANNAGFSGSDLVMAVAIALAESGGQSAVPGDQGTSIGLWQIHTTAHPEFAGWDLADPQTNANAAFSIYSASGNAFTAWTTYNNGISSTLLAKASQGVSQMQQGLSA